MKSFESQEYFDRYSPLASTEEKSIHDNINLNKQSLEKGLRNRPDPNALVDRGILRNPGKAFSDKMSQLDLAKKRDKLKVKIANRPEREELVRKLILQEQNDSREKKLDRIKQRLDDSINNRPGSLELVGKNILQVDRLLASRIQSGEITYPKVCGGDGSYSDSLSNHSTPLPSISEIDIPNTLNELSDLQSASGTPSTKSNNRNLQYSCKKTYRVGRYSFHNIEFRPAAQKAREYQQNQLVQFEEIQAQRNPNLKRLHSELAIKSHHYDDTSSGDPSYIAPKYSLLHRLNVHELKSECKIRMISCSNIPKVQLVEKLLPYESEILASHTSFDLTNRSCTPSQSNRRSMPVMKSSRDFSPPETNKNSNTNGSLYTSIQSTVHLPGPICASTNCSKLIHSHSEPLIQNHTNGCQQSVSSFINGFHFFPISNSVRNSNFSFINIDDNHYNQSLNQFNPNNSYPSLSYNPTNLTMNIESFPAKQNNVQRNLYESDNLNNWSNVNEHLTQHRTSRTITPALSYNDDVHVKLETVLFSHPDFCNAKLDLSPIIIPSEIRIPQPISIDCGNKFDCINSELSILIQIIDRIKWITLQQNSDIPSTLIDQFKLAKNNLIKMIKEMIEFIYKEMTYKPTDILNAQIQQNWLQNLLISIENNFQSNNNECIKMESDYSESNRLSDDVMNNNSNIIYKCNNNQVDGLETLNYDPINTLSIQTQNECYFSESLNNGYKEEMDHFNLNDLSIPETPITYLVNSPLYNDDFDDFMDDLLNVPENVIS